MDDIFESVFEYGYNKQIANRFTERNQLKIARSLLEKRKLNGFQNEKTVNFDRCIYIYLYILYTHLFTQIAL